jgi:hypothetical protein
MINYDELHDVEHVFRTTRITHGDNLRVSRILCQHQPPSNGTTIAHLVTYPRVRIMAGAYLGRPTFRCLETFAVQAGADSVRNLLQWDMG